MSQSVFELTDPFGFDRKKRFWDYFDGNSLKSFWHFVNVAGSGSGAMFDGIDGGYEITTGTSSSDSSAITFNGIRHFSNIACSCVISGKKVESANSNQVAGFSNDLIGNLARERFWVNNDVNFTNIQLVHADNDSTSLTAGTTVSGIEDRTYQLDLFSTYGKMTIDGDFNIAVTTDLPTVKLEPVLRHITRTNGAVKMRYRYFEAWNT